MILPGAKRIPLIFLVLTMACDSCDSKKITITTDQIPKKLSKIYQKQSDLLLSGFGRVFWDFLKGNKSPDLKKIASDECISSLKDVLDLMDLREVSALRMVTASGRLPTNFFSGAFADLGNFDQCLDPETTVNLPQRLKFMGQYCLAALGPNFPRINHVSGGIVTDLESFSQEDSLLPHQSNPKFNMSIHFGFCVPSLCARTEVEHLISKALKPYSWELVNRLSCQTERNFTQMLREASRGQKISLAFLLIVVSLVLLSTILDFMRIERAQIRNHRLLEYIRCFSMKRTMSLLMKKSDPHRMPNINIIRLISYPLGIVVHCVVWPKLIRARLLSEGTKLNPKFMEYWIVQPILNSWYTEGVIILGAQSWMVKMWRETTNKTPIISYFSRILERFRNNFIPLLTVICIDIALPLFGSGPIYQSLTGYMSGICSKNFVYSLFYVMNFIPSSEMCVRHTWSMTVETQLFAIACVVIFAYKRNPKLGLYLNLFLLMIGTGYLFFIFYSTDIPPQLLILPLDASEMALKVR
ncbi:nose resistant to fluoxetine protein 6-like [Brevipalpus obovatus]|uniref:nose resistant to fluoxetine protein 6-like n=1 Tax=Brevipalpus obovatus TaxID=246614 RepID=UPI003D9E6B79